METVSDFIFLGSKITTDGDLRALIGLCLRDGDEDSDDRGDEAMVAMLKVVTEVVMVVKRW